MILIMDKRNIKFYYKSVILITIIFDSVTFLELLMFIKLYELHQTLYIKAISTKAVRVLEYPSSLKFGPSRDSGFRTEPSTRKSRVCSSKISICSKYIRAARKNSSFSILSGRSKKFKILGSARLFRVLEQS